MEHNSFISIDLENKKARLYTTVILGSVWLFLLIISKMEFFKWEGYLTTFFLIGIGALLLLRSALRKNVLYLIFFAFIFLYTLPPKSFFLDGIFLSAHNRTYTYEMVSQVNLIFSLFLIGIYASISIPLTSQTKVLKVKRNIPVFILMTLIGMFCIIKGKSGESILNMNAVYGSNTETSSLNEYALIFFLFMYIYGGNRKFTRLILGGMLAFYVLKNLLLGGRIETIMVILLYIALELQYKISFKKMLLLLVLGAWGMSMFSTLRSNPMIIFGNEWYQIFNPFGTKEYYLNSLNNNEGDVFWAGERMLHLMKDQELLLSDRITAFSNYLLSSVVPNSMLSPLANLTNYKIHVYTTGGGGLAPVFFYVFLSYPGTLLLGIFCGVIMNLNKRDIPYWKQIYLILFLITVPRWFAYYPIHLIKFCVWGVLLYIFIESLNFTFNKYLRRN